jgi:LysM repeat protein
MFENYEPAGFEYEIQPDDTLNDLADQFDLEEEDIIDANPEVDFEALYVGQTINIPDVDFEEEAELEQRPMGPGVAPRRPSPPRFRPGVPRYDRFGRRRFCRRGTEYYVRPGDTLYRIARRYNVSIRELIRLNPNINFNYPLRIGAVLCVPY